VADLATAVAKNASRVVLGKAELRERAFTCTSMTK